MPVNLPVFPLNVVMFPGAILPLKIFEARYLDMVSNCLRNDTGFGISLIRQGTEVGEPAVTEHIGTGCRIMDWDREESGLLRISVRGETRFRLLGTEIQPDGLVRGTVEWLGEQSACPAPPGFKALQELISQLYRQYDVPYDAAPENLGDAVWLGYRLAEILPVDLGRKQEILEIDDPVARLDKLMDWTRSLKDMGNTASC